MKHDHAFIDGGDRGLFDRTLMPQGFHQVHARRDCSQFGSWFNLQTLEHFHYTAGLVERATYQSPEEFIGHVVATKAIHGLILVHDQPQHWVVPIEVDELLWGARTRLQGLTSGP